MGKKEKRRREKDEDPKEGDEGAIVVQPDDPSKIMKEAVDADRKATKRVIIQAMQTEFEVGSTWGGL